MNTIYKILLIACSVLTAFGCTDGLGLYPNDQITTDNFWKTEDDAMRAVNATYRFIFPQSDGYGCDVLFYESATDNAYNQHSNQFGNWQQIAMNAYETNHPALQALWETRYTALRRCAEVMQNIDRVQMDEAKRNRLKGEVLFQRAYNYYYLIALWGDVPWVGHKPLTIQEASSISRTAREVIADSILTDLDKAASWLPSMYESVDDGRVTKWAAFALKSRIALFMAGDYRTYVPIDGKNYWQMAANAADSVIMKSGRKPYYKYGYNGESYQKMFYDNDASSSEVLYEVQHTNLERALFGFTVKLASISDGGWNSWVPTQSLMDAYYTTNGLPIDEDPKYDPANPYEGRDPRMTATNYHPKGTTLRGIPYESQPGSGAPDRMDQWNSTKTGYGLKKYLDPLNLGTWDTGRDFPLIRLTEVYLNYAEATNELLASPSAKVRTYASASRQRVGMPSIENGLSKDKMRQRIRDERRVELAFEGSRFFDIRRWRIAEEVLNADDCWVKGMKLANPGEYAVDEKGYVKATKRSPFNQAKHYLFPIPLRETELNTKLLPNNPGW